MRKGGTVYVLIDCKHGEVVGAYQRKRSADEAAADKMRWKERNLPWDERHVLIVKSMRLRA